MSVGSIGSAALGLSAQAGQPVDPQVRQAQVNAQADLLLALRGVAQGGTVLANMVSPGSLDVYA